MPKKICPLRMLAQEGVSPEQMRDVGMSHRISQAIGCLGENCAWWNDDFGECAILALANVATRPVVMKEELGHD